MSQCQCILTIHFQDQIVFKEIWTLVRIQNAFDSLSLRRVRNCESKAFGSFCDQDFHLIVPFVEVRWLDSVVVVAQIDDFVGWVKDKGISAANLQRNRFSRRNRSEKGAGIVLSGAQHALIVNVDKDVSGVKSVVQRSGPVG